MSSGDESDNSGSDLSSSSEYSFQDDDVLEELFDSDDFMARNRGQHGP